MRSFSTGQVVALGLRYAFARRGNGAISFISISALLGMAIGVMMLIVVLSVMNGFERELRQRLLGAVSHAVLFPQQHLDSGLLREYLLAKPGVVGVAPLLQLQVLMEHSGRTAGALVSGIDPQLEPEVSILSAHLLKGELQDLRASGYGVLLGDRLARSLNVQVGDEVLFFTPTPRNSAIGILPRVRAFTVLGLFAYGAEIDSSYAYIHIADAERLMGRGLPVNLRVRLDDLFHAREQAHNLAAAASKELQTPILATDWTRTYGSLFRAVGLEKLVVGLLLSSIIAIAAFNVFTSLAMTASEKRSDIAILRTIGASRIQVLGVFTAQGLALGVGGVVLGTLLGVPLALNIDSLFVVVENWLGIQILDVYFIDYFPSHLRIDDVVVVVTAAIILSVCAALYPAWRAANQDPVETLGHE